MREFVVTVDHIKLLRWMNVCWDDSRYYGAPCIDIKRPYGNCNAEKDICKISGKKLDSDTALELHDQMKEVVEILFCCGCLKLGTYVVDDSGKWNEK